LSWRFIPNALCILRMLLVAPLAWLLIEERYLLTLIVFSIAAVTDALDGFLAKRYNWMSDLGKILDPLADKLLLVTVFVTLTFLGAVPLWLTIVVAARDGIITGGAIAYRAFIGPVGGNPTLVSKFNTLCQIVYLCVVVGARANDLQPGVAILVLSVLVLVTTLVSGYDYIITYARRTREALRERQRAVP
jgi:cardiolipin synthase